jgi:hypothetical protein
LTRRRRVAAAAAALLLGLLLAAQPFGELPRRLRSLAAFAPKELAVRRLGGSATAFDRRDFAFLENARRRLPPSTTAVVIAGAPEDDAHLYLASYQLAPLPVTFAGRDLPPRGAVVAVYGRPPAASERVLAVLPEGCLVAAP